MFLSIHCRAGRTESWAIPSEAILPLLVDLKSGKFAPAAGQFAEPLSLDEKLKKLQGDLKTAQDDLKGMRDKRDVSYQRPLTLEETPSDRW